jgi:hypothetical protein
LNHKEELKGQLAENMPGAIGLFADALTGGDVNKLLKGMESGKFKAADLATVSKEAALKAAPVLSEVRTGAAAGQNRLANAQQVSSARMNDMGINAAFGDLFSGLGKGLEDFKTGADTLGKWTASLATGLGKVAEEWLPKIGETLYDIDSYMQIVAGKWGEDKELTKEELAEKRRVAGMQSDFMGGEAGKPSVLGNTSQALFNKKWTDLTSTERDAVLARMPSGYREANKDPTAVLTGVGNTYANQVDQFANKWWNAPAAMLAAGQGGYTPQQLAQAASTNLIKPKPVSQMSSGSLVRNQSGQVVDDNGDTYVVDVKIRKTATDNVIMESFNNFQ